MFIRMIGKAFLRQWKKMAMIAFTIALGASLATAMLSVMLDVGDKVNQELKAYGANINVVPKDASVISSLYDVGDENISGAYLREDELGKIKTIFWAFNIVDYAPFITAQASLDSGSKVNVKGTWFNHHMELPTGEQLDAGVASMRSWWGITEGDWLDEQKQEGTGYAMVGTDIAKKENIHAGDKIRLTGSKASLNVEVVGVFDSGGEEDGEIFVPLDTAQELGGLDGKVDSIEVSALTTPDNELAEKAAKDPSSLSVSQYETWYCTAYVSSICYQIEEVITDSVASAVRQVADSEGQILDKTQPGHSLRHGAIPGDRPDEGDRSPQCLRDSPGADRDLLYGPDRNVCGILCGTWVCPDHRTLGVPVFDLAPPHGHPDRYRPGRVCDASGLYPCDPYAAESAAYRSIARKIRQEGS